MAKKKAKFSKGTLTTATIGASLLICGWCVFSEIDFGKATSELSDAFGLAEVQEDLGDLGKAMGDVGNVVVGNPIMAEECQFDNLQSEIPDTQAKPVVLYESGTLVRVESGDTYVLSINGKEKTVHLIGVDAPENVVPENSKESSLVSDVVKEKLTKGTKLIVEYDVSTEDEYGRTLAYLYFDNGTMVQEWLLQNGYARAIATQPNNKYAECFAAIEQKAMVNGVGLWDYD